MKDVLVGLDAGTSMIKAVAYDAAGVEIASAARANEYSTAAGGRVEQDPGGTWRKAAETLSDLAARVPDLSKRLVAIAVTGQGDGTWLIDKEGAAVGAAWLWLDSRAAALVDTFRQSSADRARFEATGTGLVACQQGAQLAWMQRHEPERLARATTAFHCKDWLYFKLTGVRATDPSEGTFTFGDFRSRRYSENVVDMLGLQPLRRLLPEMIDGTTTTAPLEADAAAAIGLLPGTPVVLGYIDVVCTALGAGLHDPGVEAGCTILGSTGAHMRLASSPDEVVLNEEATGYTMAMPLPGHYAQVQTHMAASLNVDWVLGMACEVLASQGVDRSRDDLIPQIDRWISASRPCELVFQPFISEAGERGPFFDRHARAGLFGMSTRHGFADVVRAVFEGLAFAARDCYGALGSTPREIRLTGGATRNASLRSMLAAATGASVRTVLREETGAAGAAMIAAVATGVYPTMDACVKDWVHPKLGELQAPDNVLAESYRKIWPAYAEARPAMRPVWRAMAEARLVDQ